MVYDDGSERIVRNLGDPDDLTHFSHWFQEKHLQVQLKVNRDWEARFGFCHMLAHRFPTSDRGASLSHVDVFTVRYDFPPPDANAHDFLAAQTGPPPDRVEPAFWRYDARSRTGSRLTR
jgi:hypothetical protein